MRLGYNEIKQRKKKRWKKYEPIDLSNITYYEYLF